MLEIYGHVPDTGPLDVPPAAGSAAPGGALSEVWPLPVEQNQDWSDGDDDIALHAALVAAEEDLTEHAFQPWLCR